MTNARKSRPQPGAMLPDPANLKAEFEAAQDFDPRDPLFGLHRDEIDGDHLPRRTVLRLLAAAGALGAGQLLPGLGVADARAAAKPGGTLNCGWAGVGEIRTLDPAQINQVLEFQIASNVLSGLTHINPKLIGEGDLAESWTVSPDGKEYVFKLRKGVRFHNGDPFGADDVVYTFERSKDPKKSIQSRVIKNVNAVEKIDDTTVRFRLSAPDASFFVKTLERSSGRAMTIVSRGALDKMGTQKYGLAPVGTGPFRITYHQLGQGVVLEKFEHYYDPERPKLDKVVIKPIIDNEPLAAALEAGDIQLIGGNPVAPELIDRFIANQDLVVSIVPGPGFQSLWLNPWRDPFRVADFNKPTTELMKEKGFKVRLAIAKAIDRQRYLKEARFGRGYPAYGSINPAMKFYFEDLGKTSEQRFDLATARRLLAEAGFPDGKGFPRMKMIHLPSARREAEIIKAMLKRNLNIDIGLDARDSPVALDSFLKMDFDMARIGSGGDYDPDDGLVDWMQTSSKFNGLKRDKTKMAFGYFSDREVDELVEKERVETDLEKRRALVQKANAITSDKVACAFLFHPIDALVHRKTVHFPEVSRIPGLVDLDRTTIG
jgi:peptide/nickel transport system substrate-binding protein